MIGTARLVSCAATAAAIVYGAAAAGAAGDAAITGVAWSCSQERDDYFHVQCVPQPLRADVTGATDNAGAALEPAPAMTRYDMRPVAVRGMPEVFSTRAWRIPLYSQPVNSVAVTQLLDAVLCGAAPHCTVAYDGGGLTR